jgi:hypothetical protein
MPWANDGGSVWNALKCTPLAPDPKQVGEACTVERSGVSGVDDCDIHTMCWNVDPKTNMGTCVAMCVGDESDPGCENACDVCSISGQGVLMLCLPTCDPLGQNCVPGEACYPMPSNDFACVPDASGDDLGEAGDPCEYINACDAGLFCANPDVVPGCENLGCCATFCDTAVADPCPDASMGVECVPWWAPGREPTGGCVTATLGACVLPW